MVVLTLKLLRDVLDLYIYRSYIILIYPYNKKTKTAKVTPLFKGGNKRDIGNCRFISVLQQMPEKTVRSCVCNYLN